VTTRRVAPLPFPPPSAPIDRGPLLTPEQVAARIGGVSGAWVRKKVPGKITLGQKTKRWYQEDVDRFIADKAAESAARGLTSPTVSSPRSTT
jgi:predicted DNA-binding transcriptional regulator AlpA